MATSVSMVETVFSMDSTIGDASKRPDVSRQRPSTGSPSRAPSWGGKDTPFRWVQPEPQVLQSCCAEGLEPAWADWIESGIEFFGCEGDFDPSAMTRAWMLPQEKGRKVATPPKHQEKDYARMHEEFFESLLKEQVHAINSIPGVDSTPPPLEPAVSRDEDSMSSGVSSKSSRTQDTQSTSSTRTQKRRRPLKLGNLSPRRKHNNRVAPIEAYEQQYKPKPQTTSKDKQLSLEQIALKDLPSASSFLHENCVLQKDKGKGEPFGSNISATGIEASLDKLREKMAIVVQLSGEERKAAAGMKRRQPKVTAHTPSFIETRSMIELRLGFLSIQYGLLLRWDYMKTGKIVYVNLRKMCHDSFYTKMASITPLPPTVTTTITREHLVEPPPLVVRTRTGNHAIYQRLLGAEVVLVDPPYHIPQPEIFAPSVLSVDIGDFKGLAKKSRWTLSVTFDGHTEMTTLHYHVENRTWEAESPPLTWELKPFTSFDVIGLEFRLFQQKKHRKRSNSKLASTVTMPLGGLVSQPSTSQAKQWQLKLPFKLEKEEATLTLTLSHQSEYAHWLYTELEARRKEEVSTFSWKTSSLTSYSPPDISADPSSRTDDLFDWFCGICFKDDICL